MQDCSNESSVTAEAYVGAIAGKLSSIAVDSCDNTGSAIIATGYVSSEGAKYAYVGGYVGYGYLINNCTNVVSISYTGGGKYVGGIMGYISVGACEIENLKNTASISGSDYVGGIFGGFYSKGYSSNEYAVTFTSFDNSGKIQASGNYVGGLIGYADVDNTYASWASAALYATKLTNSGQVSGKKYLGGLFGYVKTDSRNSSVMDVTATGTVSGSSNYGKRYGYVENVTFD